MEWGKESNQTPPLKWANRVYRDPGEEGLRILKRIHNPRRRYRLQSTTLTEGREGADGSRGLYLFRGLIINSEENRKGQKG